MTNELTLADIARRLDELTRAVVAPPRKYLSPEEASGYLGLSVPLLAKWRMDGDGPAFSKVGTRVSYAVADLDRFMVTCHLSVPRSLGEPLGFIAGLCRQR